MLPVLLPILLAAPAATTLGTNPAAVPSPPAAALVPDALRVTVGGQTRVVRTLGRPGDAEFYAPLAQQLRSLWLDLQPTGADAVEVRYQGNRVARWPVVTQEDQLSAARPAVLRQGDELLVPVRALVALGSGWMEWDPPHQTLTLTPTVRRLELRPDAGGLEIGLEASAPVRVTAIQLSHPSRCVIDITPAWFHLEGALQPAGIVRAIRVGQFTRETARIVMELSSGPARNCGLPQSGTAITARLQPAPATQLARAGSPAIAAESAPAAPSLSSTRPAGAGAVTSSPARPRTADPSSRPAATHRRPRVRRHRWLASRGGYVQRALVAPAGGSSRPLAGRVICVDPGHGGPDTGALGLNGLKERDACLAMARQLVTALREAGAMVLLTRDDDRYVSLEDRYTFANLKAADLFISIHCNAMARHNTMSGTETYYWTPQSLELAQAVHPEVVRVMGGRDGGIRQRQFAVIHHTTMPSILLEVGYIDNIGDEARLGDPGFQEAFGQAVRDGVIRYFGG